MTKTNRRTMPWTVVILAAGQGTRMKSGLPKVLHPLSGRPLLAHVISSCQEAGLKDIRVVVGHGKNLVQPVAEALGAQCFVQTEQRGTGHAVKCASLETSEGHILILNGDHPLIEAGDLKKITEEYLESNWELMVVSTELKDPAHMGRIVRSQGQIAAIVEAKDASSDTLKIREINTGIYCAESVVLQEQLEKITGDNAQQELYLTDVIRLGLESDCAVGVCKAPSHVGFGVNSQSELAKAQRFLFRKKCKSLMENGVVIIDPKTTYVENLVKVGSGSVLFPGVFLRGKTELGSFCAVEPGCMIIDSKIGDAVQIRSGCYLEKVVVHNQATLGPYARLRPETEIGEQAHVGNFVEMKKVKFGKKSKAGHLSYLGDADIGEEVNIGCGTITCNYAADRNKYKTKIGDRVFVGSDTQFVAPVEIGNDAIIGSGSTITKNVAPEALALVRGSLIVKDGYARRFKINDGSKK